MSDKVGAVLVVGGGIAGMQSSLDLADSGFKVYLVDKSSSIGGTMVQLDKTFPTNDCAMCILAPKLVGTGRHENIELLTYTELKEVEGEAGNFKVTLISKPRRINAEKCTGCADCNKYCPVEAIDEYNEGLGERSAIYVSFPQAVPLIFVIDREKCIGCGICQEVCKADAVEYDQEEKEISLDVGSIVLAPGFDVFDPSVKKEYGYGRFPNVLSSIEFERILSATGPYGGTVLRPYDGEVPRKVAFIQCVGSRDAKIGNNYCSSVCCMYSIKEAVIAKEHSPDLDCSIFYMDLRAFGKEFDEYYIRAEEEHGIRFVRCRVAHCEEIPESKNLTLTYVEDDEVKKEEFDLVVLSVGMRPPEDVEDLAKKFGIKLNGYNFCSTTPFSPLETSVPGIYVCGAFSSPKDIPDSVAQASGAAAKAASGIASERGKLVTVKEYPPEKDVKEEEPRIGVFVCHCGINIGGVVDVPAVVEYAKTLPNVAYAESNLYTCSQDTQEKIKEMIEEHNLNRVIVASCTPRTHEPLFRSTIREAGLNIYFFEMANIRDQCSWVHMHEHEEATEKAKDLVRSAVAKAGLLEPLENPIIDVIPVGLVIGGGLSGMTAALELARQGFETHLVEKEDELGGNLRKLFYILGNEEDPQEKLSSLIKEVEQNKKIHLYKGAEINSIDGYVGNFKTTLNYGGEEKEIEHGIVIVATGGNEYKPTEYLYGKNDRVLTQLELEERIAKGEFNSGTVVMIQCVGSRDEERPNCSRICCGHAVKNALKVKEMDPEAEVYVLYKDVRTYGFREDYYQEASSRGVVFIRYDDENKPEVTDEEGLKVLVNEPVTKETLLIEPDYLVLSAATLPPEGNNYIAQLLKIPLSRDGFFLEAHMKLRPLDFATDGIFLCGLAHSPKFIDESISQAYGAAARAATVLSKETMEMEGAIAMVDEDLCSGCRICEAVCEYSAIEMKENEEGKLRSSVLEALCKGCGVCASTCPSGAITMGHFTDAQIISQLRAVLRRK